PTVHGDDGLDPAIRVVREPDLVVVAVLPENERGPLLVKGPEGIAVTVFQRDRIPVSPSSGLLGLAFGPDEGCRKPEKPDDGSAAKGTSPVFLEKFGGKRRHESLRRPGPPADLILGGPSAPAARFATAPPSASGGSLRSRSPAAGLLSNFFLRGLQHADGVRRLTCNPGLLQFQPAARFVQEQV